MFKILHLMQLYKCNKLHKIPKIKIRESVYN